MPGAHPTSGIFSGMAAAFSQQPSPAASPPAAVTPLGMSSQSAPTGSTPNAKRPMDRVSIDVALTGSRIMTNEDLSGGFTNLQRLQSKDEGFQTSVSQAVHWNADLFNKLVTRVNTLEAPSQLVTDETKQAFNGVNEQIVKRDGQLREELNQMAVKLETGFAKLGSTATSAQTASSSEGLELVRLSTSLDALQARMLEWTEKAQAQINATVVRAEETQFQVVGGKLNKLFFLYQSAGPAPAPASWRSC